MCQRCFYASMEALSTHMLTQRHTHTLIQTHKRIEMEKEKNKLFTCFVVPRRIAPKRPDAETRSRLRKKAASLLKTSTCRLERIWRSFQQTSKCGCYRILQNHSLSSSADRDSFWLQGLHCTCCNGPTEFDPLRPR